MYAWYVSYSKRRTTAKNGLDTVFKDVGNASQAKSKNDKQNTIRKYRRY
jgi:hypothetical protein